MAHCGTASRRIQERIAELELDGVVKITGWISSERVRVEMALAHALVLPSFAEGLPVVLMEAMALRRPVVSTYVAGIPELVNPGRTGWLVPTGDVALLADAMREALSAEPRIWTRMGEAARERVFERHDITREAEKIERLLRMAIRREALC